MIKVYIDDVEAVTVEKMYMYKYSTKCNRVNPGTNTFIDRDRDCVWDCQTYCKKCRNV